MARGKHSAAKNADLRAQLSEARGEMNGLRREIATAEKRCDALRAQIEAERKQSAERVDVIQQASDERADAMSRILERILSQVEDLEIRFAADQWTEIRAVLGPERMNSVMERVQPGVNRYGRRVYASSPDKFARKLRGEIREDYAS